MKKRRKIFIAVFILIAITLMTVVFCNYQVEAASKDKIYNSISDVPTNRVGLLLGTGKYLASGSINPYYQYRIDATVALMEAGKIKYLVISGDNGRKEYNEPETMRADLMAAGIDSTRIWLDYAGFRTFDSIVRLKKIFSQDSVTIISQKFHNQRALFIAGKEGITAVGFNAKDVSKRAGFKVKMREKLARVKVFTDYLFGQKPKYLGPKVQIPSV